MDNITISLVKTCKVCGLTKELSYFRDRVKKDKKYYSNTCKKCVSNQKIEYRKQYYIDNKEKINEKHRKNYENSKEIRKEKQKIYYEKNKELSIAKSKEYHKNNPEIRKKCNRNYHATHKEQERQYRINNRDKINQRGKERRSTDAAYKLRHSISRDIYFALKKNGHSKNNQSIIKFLPYSMAQLKQHIENLFEPWMNWNNRGKYNPRTWNDNNPLTWKWNLDHIIPHSDLPYKSMEDENFKKCWALENLRPYSAKQNIIDGSTKVRHKKAA